MATGCIMTIGNFDGVHLGHRAILNQAHRLGEQRGLPVRVLTFDPHPISVLQPGAEPPILSDLEKKMTMLRAVGAEEVVVLEPTADLLSLSPERFLQRVAAQHQPAAIVEGANFRFGKGRVGDIDVLRDAGRSLKFETHIVPQVEVSLWDQALVPVSSTWVRWLLAHGRVADAARCLGGCYTLTGSVVAGAKRGRTIGVPTAKLDQAAIKGRMVPGYGVYAGSVCCGEGASYPAAISVGPQPTFGCESCVIEAHLLGFEGDLYGRQIAIIFSRWLRDLQPFPSVEGLRGQIRRDINQTQRWHGLGLLENSVGSKPLEAAG